MAAAKCDPKAVHLAPILKVVIREIKKYLVADEKKTEKATQACCWVDFEALRHYEEESVGMQDKVFQLETYIEELEQTIQEVRDQRDMAFEEARLASEHGLKLMRQSLMYKVCKRGRKIHFKENCPHYMNAEHLDFCSVCTSEGAVSRLGALPITRA